MDKEKILQKLNDACTNTLMQTLGIRYTDVGEDYLTAEMEVNERVHQPAGILHGGASIALAESVGSAASTLLVPSGEYNIVGLNLNARHIKSLRSGKAIARATLLHKGRSTHYWEIRIHSDRGDLISICHLTNMILPK